MASVMGSAMQRRQIVVQGIVQGVGFRPFVYGQALARGLVGFVYNDSMGVTIEIEGSVDALDGFQQALIEEKPPLARIDTLVCLPIALRHETAFVIAASQTHNTRQALIAADTATCNDCLHELFEPTDRRYLYPFINCTNCGPRFTIIQDVPYDRDKTTMRNFRFCPTCQQEYENPLNRRFHAQPNACPVCGPQVQLLVWSASSPARSTPDPLTRAAEQLAQGAILAIKGLGGYHLACDATNVEAVHQLRQRKHREAKPFAVMVPDLATASRLCLVNSAEATLLQSQRRPIVLLAQRSAGLLAAEVAPGYSTLGIMLPYTPLHFVLLRAFAALKGSDQLTALVMTSGNLSDEPIAYQDQEAQQRLSGIADGVLFHNRAIHMRCDDSVMRIAAGGEQFLRRSRGYVPQSLALSCELPVPLLACGGHFKNTFCLGKGHQAFVSHHIGDLENLATLNSFGTGIQHFQRLFDIVPEAIAYDLHPEYLATKYALDTDIPQKIGVQHHHAHIASVLAEHGLQEPVIGVAADGTGYGTDGAIWGCEIMRADLHDFERLAHLQYVSLPGGEQAVRQPWRMAAVYLAQTFGDTFLDLNIPFVRQLDRAKWHVLEQMLARNINSPRTSSLGRLFDAMAALVGIRQQVLYEGQAAIELEILAASIHSPDTGQYPFTIQAGKPALLDATPCIRAIVNDLSQAVPIEIIARRCHRSIALVLAQSCALVREQSGLNVVALSGGVFQNRLLLELLIELLTRQQFQVYINRRVPPNDGGLCLGQLAVAATRLQRPEA